MQGPKLGAYHHPAAGQETTCLQQISCHLRAPVRVICTGCLASTNAERLPASGSKLIMRLASLDFETGLTGQQGHEMAAPLDPGLAVRHQPSGLLGTEQMSLVGSA